MSILPALISHLGCEISSRQLPREIWHSEFSDRPDFIPTYFKVQAKTGKPGLQRPWQFLKRLVRPGVPEQRSTECAATEASHASMS